MFHVALVVRSQVLHAMWRIPGRISAHSWAHTSGSTLRALALGSRVPMCRGGSDDDDYVVDNEDIDDSGGADDNCNDDD
eukprot:2048567-Karenia_brevis.AAC.1